VRRLVEKGPEDELLDRDTDDEGEGDIRRGIGVPFDRCELYWRWKGQRVVIVVP